MHSLAPKRNTVTIADSESQHGFTLIELSIVLIIIGLIIGGIIKGQEVVTSARLKLQIAQINAVQTAVNTFQEQYGYLPGDLTASAIGLTDLNGTAYPGDENGYIAAAGATSIADSADLAAQESLGAWVDLYATNFLVGIQLSTVSNAYTPTTSITAAVAGHLPAKISGAYVYIGTFSSPWGSTAATVATMARLQGNRGGVVAGAAGLGVMTPPDAAGIDTKFDDGNPTTGVILSANYPVAAATTCTTVAPVVSTTTTYTTTVANLTGNNCDLDFILQ